MIPQHISPLLLVLPFPLVIDLEAYFSRFKRRPSRVQSFAALRCSVALPLYHPPSFKWKGLILYFAYSDAIPLHNAEQLKLRTAC